MVAITLHRMAERASTTPFFAETVTKTRYLPFRLHDLIDVVLVRAGEGWHVSHPGGERRLQPLSPGHLVLYRPGDEIVLRGKEPQGLTVTYVSSPIAEWQLFTSMVGVDPAWQTVPEPPIAAFPAEDPEVARIFDTAEERFRTGPTSLDLVQFWIGMIPLLFPSAHRTFAGTGAPPWLLDALTAMREERNLRGGVPRLAELSHVSSAHLSVTVRRHFDRTPTELVTMLRVRHAAFLLSTTAEPIAVIARRCGFSSTAYFSTTFRREHHVTATEYRSRSITRTLSADVH